MLAKESTNKIILQRQFRNLKIQKLEALADLVMLNSKKNKK
jgi:hypothetical protein